MSSDEKRTINLMKTLLKSGDVEEKFEEIIENCKNNNIKYTDPDFYPQKRIIDEDRTLLANHEWRRIENQYPSDLFENISPDSVRQGKLGDCYLIVSLIYTAHNKELVKYLFHPKSSLKYGCALVYFYFLGERFPVIVDTQVPYRDSDASKPLFSRPRSNDDSCWFVLVEKAFAKACGGYYSIEIGQTHFGIHVLFDQFPAAFSKIEDLIPESKKGEIDLDGEIFKELINLKKKNAMIGTSVSMSFFPDHTQEELQKASGLIPEHAYQILDICECENKKFLKIRNPWGKFEWKGAYSNKSDDWTETLKKQLNYSNNKDGSFWMLYEDFKCYFKSISYSLPKEKGWKEYNVYGKIEGYLDGRSPCSESRNVGCIPQWLIKFSRKTIVRLSYDVAGPATFHGLYICKNHGRKVDSLGSDIEIMRITTNTNVNGIEYVIDDYSEPYTFFLNRAEIEKDPCYYRILIESPDKRFKVEKFNDNFVKEKWNSVSYQEAFASTENDQWDPYGERPLSTCRQWYFRFPDLQDDEECELRIQLFKNVSEGPIFLILAQTDTKISYALKKMKYFHFTANAVSDYEEFSIPLNYQFDEYEDEEEEEVNEEEERNRPHIKQYSFCIYRMEQKDVNQFKFIASSKKKIEFGLLPEPDPIKNCGYTISGILNPGKMDGASPYESSAKSLKQWCLLFKKSPTIIFVDYSHSKASSLHSVYLEMKNKVGDKIDTFYEGTVHFDFDIPPGCLRDQIMWRIDDISKPYALCVAREQADTTSEFVVNIFGTKEFEMLEINDSGIGKSAKKYNQKNAKRQKSRFLDFTEIRPVEQPLNFKPRKKYSKSIHDDFDEDQKHKTNFQEMGNTIEGFADSILRNETIKQTDDLMNDIDSNEKKKIESKCCILI